MLGDDWKSKDKIQTEVKSWHCDRKGQLLQQVWSNHAALERTVGIPTTFLWKQLWFYKLCKIDLDWWFFIWEEVWTYIFSPRGNLMWALLAPNSVVTSEFSKAVKKGQNLTFTANFLRLLMLSFDKYFWRRKFQLAAFAKQIGWWKNLTL